MIDSKLTFHVQEISEGKSHRQVGLSAEDLAFEELEGLRLKQAQVELAFDKTTHFIRVDYVVTADLEIVCDRSLRPFDHHVEAGYQVLFKPEVEEPSESERSKVKAIDRDMCIRIDQEVRDSILLVVPVRRLHPDFLDATGHPTEFEVRAFGAPEQDDDPEADPRWEALKKLKRES